jgi:hypothetical protein
MLIKLPTHTTRKGHDLRGCGKTVSLPKFISAAKSRETKQSIYGSAEALRHPKAAIQRSFRNLLSRAVKGTKSCSWPWRSTRG